MTFFQWLHSRGVARDSFCIAIGYLLASAWADRLFFVACFAFGLVAYLVRRRYVEWAAYSSDLAKLRELERRAT